MASDEGDRTPGGGGGLQSSQQGFFLISNPVLPPRRVSKDGWTVGIFFVLEVQMTAPPKNGKKGIDNGPQIMGQEIFA